MSNDFTDLEVWQFSKDLVVEIYRITAQFPKEEIYGLTSQLRRAAVSIGSNIAEGSARRSNKDFRRFVLIAIGSAAEVKCQLLFSQELGFIYEATTNQMIEKIHRIARMLKGLRNSLEKD